MRWVSGIRERVGALLFRSAEDAELEEELQHHLDMEVQENLRAGMNPEEARRQAAVAFGGMERHKEAVQEARGLEALRED